MCFVVLDSTQEGLIGVLIGASVGIVIVGTFILYKCIRHRRTDYPSTYNGMICEVKPTNASFIFKVHNSDTSQTGTSYVPVNQDNGH